MKTSNPLLRRTSVMLERAGKKQDAPIWTKASSFLSNRARTKVEVNVGRISRLVDDGQAVFVPGKVLGNGLLAKKVVIGAFAFSNGARSKIEASGGAALTIEQFLKKYPKGSGVMLVR